MNQSVSVKKELTFEEMCELEPALEALKESIRWMPRILGRRKRFCANEWWYFCYKQILCCLVGWDARHPQLKGEHNYNVAYDTLYHLLPDCRNCSCFRR